MTQDIDNTKDYNLEPLIEVLPYSKIKERDVIILRCNKGEENEEIAKMNTTLKTLIQEKDLRILAVTPDFNLEDLSLAIQVVSNWE
jgi:hypothetical protein